MKYPQNLSYYTHNFEYVDWIIKETNHYIFHYIKNSVAERDINRIANIQEKAYKKIISFLNLPQKKLPSKIYYYFYPNKKTKKKLMGDDWYAQAILKEIKVHMLYTNKIKPIGPHEDVHLLVLPFGFPIGFIQEGFAEYMVGHDWYCNNLDKTAKEGINKGFIKLNPKLLYFHQEWQEINNKYLCYYYAFAGSFVGFLMKKYGKEKFLKLYTGLKRKQNKENKKLYLKIFQKDCETLLEIWQKTQKIK